MQLIVLVDALNAKINIIFIEDYVTLMQKVA